MQTYSTGDGQREHLWQAAYDAQNLKAPFFTATWHRLWHSTLAPDWEPLILQPTENIIAPLAKRDRTIIFSGGQEISDYMDLVGPDEKKATAWQEILDYLATTQTDTIDLHNLPAQSASIAFFQELARSPSPAVWNITITQEDTTPHMKLAPSWEAYVSSLERKSRHELRRKMRKFEHTFPGTQVTQSANPAQDIAHLIRLMKLDPDKQQFFTPAMETFFQKLPSMFTKDISLLLLSVNHTIVAAVLGFCTPTSYLLYNSGFDEAQFSGAGFYLKAHSIKHAIASGFTEYNFLQGNERYKYELGGKDAPVYRILLQR